MQVHNWSVDLRGTNLEFVAPTKVYVVTAGEVTMLDLMQLPNLSPRQIKLLANQGSNWAGPASAAPAAAGGLLGGLWGGEEEAGVSHGVGHGNSTLQSIPLRYLVQRMGASGAVCDGWEPEGREEEEEQEWRQGGARWRDAASAIR